MGLAVIQHVNGHQFVPACPLAHCALKAQHVKIPAPMRLGVIAVKFEGDHLAQFIVLGMIYILVGPSLLGGGRGLPLDDT